MSGNKTLVIFLSICAILSGCTGDPDFSATIEVIDVEYDSEAEYCGSEDDHHCVTLTVEIDVTGGADFSTNMFYWDAVDTNGSITSAPWVHGADACAAGFKCTVTLDFDVADGEKLAQLRWSDIFNEVSPAQVPNYDTE